MKRKRFSVEQIVAVLKQAEAGMPVAELIRHVGISEQTFYRWKKVYAGSQTDQVLLLVDMCVLANNTDPQLAQFLRSAPAQTKAAEAGKQILTNQLAKMPAAMQQSLGNIDEPVRKVTVVDWTAINARRAQWDTRWNRQIER